MGHLEAVRWLLNKGANQYLENNEYEGFTPLHVAINCGYQNVANLLLDRQQEIGNIDVNAFDYSNVTPLHLAAEKGFKDIANRLIALGANCEAEDEEKKLHLIILLIILKLGQ
jgi:ankyrin repeat protein